MPDPQARQPNQLPELPAAARITRGQWLTLIAAFLGWMFDGFEMGLFPLVARPALSDLMGPGQTAAVEPWLGMMAAVFLVGAATGGVLFGWLGDRIGRVRAMTLSVLTYTLFMGMCGLSRTAEEVFAYRFICSLGMGGEWSLGVALVMEIWPNESRGKLAALIGAASNVGFLTIAVISLGVGQVIGSLAAWLLAAGIPQSLVTTLVDHGAWRLLMLTGIVPALLAFLIRLFVPESERWKKEQQSGATSHWATVDLLGVAVGALGPMGMIFLCAPNWSFSLPTRVMGSVLGVGLALFGYTYPVRRYLSRAQPSGGDPRHAPAATFRRMLVGACLTGVALLGTWGAVQFAPSWADKLVEKSSAEQGLSPEAAAAARSAARSYTQILSSIGAIFGTIAGALLGNAIGRRATYTLLCLASLASALVFFRMNTEYGPFFLATIAITGGTTASFYGWIPLYLPELFRTCVRATGQGFSFNFGRILAAVGALQTGNLIRLFDNSYPNACTLIISIYVLGVFLIWLAPETRGEPLPD